MIGTTAAILGGVSAGSNILGGIFGKKGANAQANAAMNATNQANNLQWGMYQQGRQDQMPWMQQGTAAVNKLGYLLGLGDGSRTGTKEGITAAPDPKLQGLINETEYMKAVLAGQNPVGANGKREWGSAPSNPDTIAKFQAKIQQNQMQIDQMKSVADTQRMQQTQQYYGAPGEFGSLAKDFTMADFQKDPSYEWRLGEGMKALEKTAAAKGSLFSGGTLQDLTKYGQNFASTEYGNAFDRYNQNRVLKYNQLAGLSNTGQVSAGNMAQQGMNTAELMGNNTIGGMTSAAAARASGYGALGQGLQGAGNTALTWGMLSRMGLGGGVPKAPNPYGLPVNRNTMQWADLYR